MYLALGRAEPATPLNIAIKATPRPVALTRVKDTRFLPYGHVCRIVARSHDQPGISIGTGVLIGTHHVLTCAHNIFPSQAPRTKSIDVIPMQNGDDGKWPVYRANGWTVRKRWKVKDCHAAPFDLGLIRLAKPATSVFWELSAFDPARLAGLMVDLSGYPSTREPRARHMYWSRGTIDGTLTINRCTDSTADGRLLPSIAETSNLIAHSLDTAPSQSGGPMWALLDGKRILLALHAGRIDQNQRGKAILLNATVRRVINHWMTRTLPVR
jgi:V8-like Glu-specific endopeptidase